MDDYLSRTAALSAPASLEAEKKLCAVILVVSSLSVIGAGWMISSFIIVPSLRTFRHQLILGLGLSDFMMALNVTLSASLNLSGHHIWAKEQEGFCSFNGFMNQMFVIQTDYWILTIAVCTYLILMDHTSAAAWIQQYRVILWSIPWILSILWAALGLVLAGYGSIGAWCWFTSDRLRLLANFTPRWVIIVVILGLYTRLCIFLYKSHKALSEQGINSGTLPTELQPLPTEIQQWQILDGHAGLPSSHVSHSGPSLRNISIRMMIYPTVYALIWVVPTIVRIYHGVTGKQSSLSLSIIDNSCIICHGLADAIIYGVNERARTGWGEHFQEKWPWKSKSTESV